MTDDPETDSLKEQEATNMDWKKNGFDKRERLTLKINMEEAIRRKSNDKISKQNRTKLRAKPTKNKAFRKQKIRNSIYDDEDEEEEDYILMPVFNNMPKFSLEKALTQKEKKQLAQMENSQEKEQQAPEQIQITQINQQIKPKVVEPKEPQVVQQPQYEPKDDRFGYIDLAKIEVKVEESPLYPLIEEKKKAPKKQPQKSKPQKKEIIDEINQKLAQKEDKQPQNKEPKDTRDIILEKTGRSNQNQKPQKEEKSPAKEKSTTKNQERENLQERENTKER